MIKKSRGQHFKESLLLALAKIKEITADRKIKLMIQESIGTPTTPLMRQRA